MEKRDNYAVQSAIARQLHVTTGTLTISMNSLVKKGYIRKVQSREDKTIA